VVRQVQLWDFFDEVQEQRARASARHTEDGVFDDDDEDWEGFFARLQELGFELPSGDEEDDHDNAAPSA